MASVEASAYLSAIEWGDEGYYLKEFARKFQLPRVAKIIKGQYRNLGVPTLPTPSLHQIVLVASAGAKLKVVAQCVKFKDTGRRAVPVGTKLSLPENYDGWFEILSEDGLSARCMESVAELAKSNRPCLVRDSIKVYTSKPDNPDAISDKTRTLCAGEVLNVGLLVSSDYKGASRMGKFLKCVTSHGDTVYLPLELRGKFSSIAGEQNISGVHSVKNLMSKRFPFMVRLVHGKSPVGVKFVPEMRLLSFVEEESLMAMPLSKENVVVPLPQNAALKVLAPRNSDSLVNLREHEILVNKCICLSVLLPDCIQVCTANAVKDKKQDSLQLPQYISNSRRQPPTLYSSISLVECNSTDSPRVSGKLNLQRELSVPAELPSHLSDDYRYDEIDRIYDYVRGFAPLPSSIKNECSFGSSCGDDLKHVSLPQIGQILHPTNNGNYSKPPDLPPDNIISHRPFKLTTRGFPPQRNVTANLVNRTQRIRTKGVSAPSHKSKEPVGEPIYEKIDHRRNSNKPAKPNEPLKGLLRSYSTSKISHQDNVNANNINERILHHKKQLNHQRPLPNPKQQRLCSSFNSQKNNVPSRVKPSTDKRRPRIIRKKSNSGEQNVATSPLFHIRYKSLTDLLLDDGKVVPGKTNNDSSGNSYDSNTPSSDRETAKNNDDSGSKWLARPKSLSNLINNEANGRRRLDNHNYYALVQNDIIGVSNCDNSKFYTMPDATRYTKNHYGSATRKKKFETMYL